MTCICLTYFIFNYPGMVYKCWLYTVTCSMPIEKMSMNIAALWAHQVVYLVFPADHLCAPFKLVNFFAWKQLITTCNG